MSKADLTTKTRSRAGLAGALAFLLSGIVARESSAQVADVSMRATLFHEGSPTSALTVVTVPGGPRKSMKRSPRSSMGSS